MNGNLDELFTSFSYFNHSFFSSFPPHSSTLVPKANSWLQENTDIHLIKCETIEKKVCTVHDLTQDSSMFTAKGANAIYVKGLRYISFHL